MSTQTTTTDNAPTAHRIIEATDYSPTQWALTIQWPDRSETVEYLSDNAAKALGFSSEEQNADEEGAVETIAPASLPAAIGSGEGTAGDRSYGGPGIRDPLVGITRKPGKEPCGECPIQPGETCDICGAYQPHPQPPSLSEVEEAPAPDPVEGAKALLGKLDPEFGPPERYVKVLRHLDFNDHADAIEATLATLTAPQEQDGGGR